MRRILWWWLWAQLLYAVPRRRAPDTSWTHADWYQIFVRSFRHGAKTKNALDKWGDLPGIIEAIDNGYIPSLRVKVLWLGPLFESPQVDGGYDVKDFFRIDPQYGTEADLIELLEKAHRWGIKVVIDFPFHHVSTDSEIYRLAANRPRGLRPLQWLKHLWYRGFILWCKEEEYPNAVNAFPARTKNKTWSEEAQRFYHNTFLPVQADLNFRKLRVMWFTVRAMRKWLKVGVDGFRLDAVRHLYKWGDTTCEGLPEVHVFLGWLRWWLDWFFPGRVFVAEANEPPEKLAKYFGTKGSAPRGLKAALAAAATAVVAAVGVSFPPTSVPSIAGLVVTAVGYIAAFGVGRDRPECHVVYGFHYVAAHLAAHALKLAAPMYEAIRAERLLYSRAPAGAVAIIYIHCHDDMTLEHDRVMRAVVQREFSKLDPRLVFEYGIVARMRTINGGTRAAWEADLVVTHTRGRAGLVPYGNEVGMGDHPGLDDRDSLRKKFAWGPDGYAGWSVDERGLAYPGPVMEGPFNYQDGYNVRAQDFDPDSYLNWMRRLLAWTSRHRRVLSEGETVALADDWDVFAYARMLPDEALAIVRAYNAADFVLNLARFTGWVVTDETPSLRRKSAVALTLSEAGTIESALEPDEYHMYHLVKP